MQNIIVITNCYKRVMEIIFVSVGIVVGVLIGWLMGKSKAGSSEAKREMLQNDNTRLQETLTSAEQKIDLLNEEKGQLIAEKALLQQEVNYKNVQNEHSLQEIEQLNLRQQGEKEKILEQNRLQIENLIKEHQEVINSLKREFSQQKEEQLELFRQQLSEKEKVYALALNTQEKHHKETLSAQEIRFEETMAKIVAQMKTATNDMLRERQKEFSESSNINLGMIVTPLKETIDKMKQAMSDNTLKQTAISSEMRASIEHMMRQSEAAQKSADELTRVFKHRAKVQGDWGETVLAELLQSQGLTQGIHFDTQAVIYDSVGNIVRTEEGKSMRPDIILHLDQRRELIIDSKVSLTAFMDYINADNESDRQLFLKSHLDSIQKHIKELSAKDYSSYIKPPKVKMDYVIMFVPHSGAMWIALNTQPDLWRKAMEKNVFIADEQSLFAALRIINMTWTQITQIQQHERVYELATEMLDRVGQFIKKYELLGKALQSAQTAFDEGQRKLNPNGQSIINTAGKLIKLGAKQSSKNPIPQLIDVEEIAPLTIPSKEELSNLGQEI